VVVTYFKILHLSRC